MSAPSSLVFYGLRFEIPPAEIESLEDSSDERMRRARREGLDTYWGNFAEPAERYLLFIGKLLSVVGPENAKEYVATATEVAAIEVAVKARLASSGFEEDARLFVTWQADA